MLSISFEVDVSTGKVSGSLLFEARASQGSEIEMLGNAIFNVFFFGPKEQSKFITAVLFLKISITGF